jgi:hypothetical protein
VHALLAGVNAAAVACAAHTDSTSCEADTANLCSYASSAMSTGSLCSTTTPAVASADCRAHADRASCVADVTHACSWSATAMLCSGIAADQTLSILSDLGTALGSIVGGQISATLDSLPVTFLAMGHLITLQLHHVRISGRITQAGITNGELGGELLTSDVCSCDFCFPNDCESLWAPDLMPSADGQTCAAVSAGMAYEAITATLMH